MRLDQAEALLGPHVTGDDENIWTFPDRHIELMRAGYRVLMVRGPEVRQGQKPFLKLGIGIAVAGLGRFDEETPISKTDLNSSLYRKEDHHDDVLYRYYSDVDSVWLQASPRGVVTGILLASAKPL